jgi:hypothetical protein
MRLLLANKRLKRKMAPLLAHKLRCAQTAAEASSIS